MALGSGPENSHICKLLSHVCGSCPSWTSCQSTPPGHCFCMFLRCLGFGGEGRGERARLRTHPLRPPGRGRENRKRTSVLGTRSAQGRHKVHRGQSVRWKPHGASGASGRRGKGEVSDQAAHTAQLMQPRPFTWPRPFRQPRPLRVEKVDLVL